MRGTEVFIQNNKLVKKIYGKSTYRQKFLNVDLEHHELLKNSEAPRSKRICTTQNDFNQYFQELKQKFINQGYKAELINKHIKTVEKIDWKELLKERDNTTSKETKIPRVLKKNRSLPNISKVVRKHWNFLSMNKSFK